MRQRLYNFGSGGSFFEFPLNTTRQERGCSMRIAVAMRSLLRFRHVLVLAVLLVLVAAAAPADAQTLLRTLDSPYPQANAYFGSSVAVGDVNGDGKVDIAVGSPGETVGGHDLQGRVYVFSGASGALLLTLDTPTPSPNPQECSFGCTVALGDMNDDGKADIAVGAVGETVGGNSYQGRAYVFSGADGALLFTLDKPNPPQAEAYFGSSLAVGDINDDGNADIAVGAFYEDVGGNNNQGRAYVFSGADGSLLRTLNTPNPQAGANFGYSLAAGDVNGDGKGDVAVGAPYEDVDPIADQGRAYVFSGDTGLLLFTLDLPTPNAQAGADFGYSVAVGDVNGDDKADIAVGAPYEDVDPIANQGRAYVFSGATGLLLFTLDTPNPQAEAYFGLPLAMGDVNGDGKADIAVGASYADVGGNMNQGRAYVFSGADGSFLLTLDTPNPQAHAHFGWSLAVGEVNGDGRGEIAVGAEGEDVGVNYISQGRAYVFSSAPAPAPSGSHRRSHTPTPTPTPVVTSTPVLSATPVPPAPTPPPAATGRAEVGPTLKLPATGSGGESGASAKGSGWTVGAYAVLAAGTALAVGGWYARRRWLR
jgi:hypothetical protein